MEIYYATTNLGKVQSLQRDLDRYHIRVIQAPLNLPEPRSDDVELIATEKVRFAYNIIRRPVVALDAGFYIHSLNGFPKAFVNFILETIDIEGILRLVEGRNRSCEFMECLAYFDASLIEPKCFLVYVKGNLAPEPRGVMQRHLWSRLGLIFIPEGSQKTLAEMTYEEYLEWRKIHREEDSTARLFSNWFLERTG